MNDETENKSTSKLWDLLLSLALLPFEGWVIKLMWGWFIVPLGVMSITIWHAIGIDAIVSYFTFSLSRKGDSDIFWARPLRELLFLLFAFVVHLLM